MTAFRAQYAIVTATKLKTHMHVICKPWLSKPTIEEATSASSYEDSPKSAGSILEADLYFCLMEKLEVDMKVS